MKVLPFKSSSLASLGVELEFQIIDPITYDMISRAKDLIRNIHESPYQKNIKPEITQSMIEINSSISQSPKELYEELIKMRDFLLAQGKKIGINFCGGGTHPFQKWSTRKIFPTRRFRTKSNLYRYLSKRSTVFGQHIHIGCRNGEEALYLTHALTRYAPHFIALSAASPFFEGVNTGYHTSRSHVFSAFPTSGVIPYLTTWEEFSNYFFEMHELGVMETMKDIYWDIRPKPEFGTVEIRVCDTPLTIRKAVNIAAYIQTVAHYLLTQRPFTISRDFYYLYNYNRFQATRYGLEGDIVDPCKLKHILIYEDILQTIKKIKKSANELKTMPYIVELTEDVINKRNDAVFINKIYKKVKTLPLVVREQCILWRKN